MNKNNFSKAGVGETMKIIFRKYAIVFALIILIAVLSVISDRFFTFTNFITILTQTSINAILAIGVTFVILTGGIDLSVGSMLAVSGVAFAMIAKVDANGEALFPPALAVLAGIFTGLLFGLLNGLIVAKAKVAPFIVTLGTMTISRGIALIVADGRPVSGMSSVFKSFGSGSIGGIPYLVIIMIMVSVIAIFLLGKTKFGRYIYAVGGNEEAARASGIPASNVKMMVYIICGFMAGLSGIMQACRVVVGQPNAGEGYELQAISAVVIGGTALSGGIGKMWGTIVGAFIIGVLGNGLDLLGVSSYWQKVISGIIIIAAVLLDRADKK